MTRAQANPPPSPTEATRSPPGAVVIGVGQPRLPGEHPGDASDEEAAGLLKNRNGGGGDVPPFSQLSAGHPLPPPVKVDVKVVAADQEEEPQWFGVSLKWIALAALTLQTSGQAILIKWSTATSPGQPHYLKSSAVFLIEVVKFNVSLALVAQECGGLRPGLASLRAHFTQAPLDLLKAAVPSLIYTVQNNLMFYSFEKLSAPVQQVLYQMKIITTAGLGVVMLGKPLSPTKWAACFMLAMGVALVQWPRDGGAGGSMDCSGDFCLPSGDQVKGFLAVLCACFTSGFAGVWIQRMLQQTKASIWVRNVQLALFGSIMGLLVALVQDGQRIAEDGILQGYNHRVVSMILMTAFGGLLCAVMLKYAGATHGCFSTALSIVLTSHLSRTMLGDFSPDSLFVLGTLLAIGASLLFALGLPQGLLGSFGGEEPGRSKG